MGTQAPSLLLRARGFWSRQLRSDGLIGPRNPVEENHPNQPGPGWLGPVWDSEPVWGSCHYVEARDRAGGSSLSLRVKGIVLS